MISPGQAEYERQNPGVEWSGLTEAERTRWETVACTRLEAAYAAVEAERLRAERWHEHYSRVLNGLLASGLAPSVSNTTTAVSNRMREIEQIALDSTVRMHGERP